MNHWRHGWFDTQRIACRDTEFKPQAVESGEKAAFQPVAARREGRVAGDAERMMDGIFVGHHERTGASLFLSERGLLRGTRVQRKTEATTSTGCGDACTRSDCESATAEAQVHSETRCGTVWTPGCEACVALAGGAQRVAKPHSDECRARRQAQERLDGRRIDRR